MRCELEGNVQNFSTIPIETNMRQGEKDKRKPVFQSKYIGMRELFTMVSGTNSGYGVHRCFNLETKLAWLIVAN